MKDVRKYRSKDFDERRPPLFSLRFHLRLLALGSLLGFVFFLEGRLEAQLQSPPSERLLEKPKPNWFPVSPARPLEGDKPEEKFSDDPNRTPLGGFFQPMQGTDAVIELILGQGRLLRTKAPLAKEGGAASIAVGDPSVLDFEVLPNPNLIRITGKRAGVTDLSFVTSDDESFSFEVRVQYDLDFLNAQLQRLFPDARIRLSQIREHLILEGQGEATSKSARSMMPSVPSWNRRTSICVCRPLKPQQCL